MRTIGMLFLFCLVIEISHAADIIKRLKPGSLTDPSNFSIEIYNEKFHEDYTVKDVNFSGKYHIRSERCGIGDCVEYLTFDTTNGERLFLLDMFRMITAKIGQLMEMIIGHTCIIGQIVVF